MVKISTKELNEYMKAKRLIIELKNTYTPKQLFNKYNLIVDTNPESDYEDEIFYNDDLRSHCGYMEDESTLEIEPIYYASFYPENFRKLIEDAKSITISD